MEMNGLVQSLLGKTSEKSAEPRRASQNFRLAVTSRNQEKGGLAKGGSAESSATPKNMKYLRILDPAAARTQSARAKRDGHFVTRYPPASYRSLSGPLGPKSPKSLEAKSGKSLENVSSGLFRDFFQTFWDPGRRPQETFFQTFLGFRARRARDTPVARGRVRKFCDTL